MQKITKLEYSAIPGYIASTDLKFHLTVKDDNIVGLDIIEPNGKTMRITVAAAYSDKLAFHAVEDGVFADKWVLCTPHGDLSFPDEVAVTDYMSDLPIKTQVLCKIEKRKVRIA